MRWNPCQLLGERFRRMERRFAFRRLAALAAVVASLAGTAVWAAGPPVSEPEQRIGETDAGFPFPWPRLANGACLALLVGLLVRERRRNRMARQGDVLLTQTLDELLATSGLESLVINGTSYGIIVTSAEDRIIRIFNAGAEKILGFRSEEVVGKRKTSVFYDHAQVAERASELEEELGVKLADPSEAFIARVRSGGSEEREWVFRRKDGTKVPVLLNITGLRRPDGSILAYIGFLYDLTERKAAEAAARESESVYHSLVEHLPVGIYRKDAAGRYVFVNPCYCRLRGASADQILGRSDLEVGALESMELTVSPDWILDSQGEQHHRQIMQTGQTIELEEIWTGQDGRQQHLHVVKSAVTGADGEIVGSHGILVDFTERKRMESQLAKQEQEFRALAENSPDPIIRYDREGRRIYANQAMLRLCGQSPEILLGTSPAESPIVSAADNEAIVACVRRVLETGGNAECQVRFESLDGRFSLFHNRYVPEQMADGSISSVLCISSDITERNRVMTLLAEREQRMTRLFANAPGCFYTAEHRPDGRYVLTYASPRFVELFGMDVEDALRDAATLAALAHPDDLAAMFRQAAESECEQTPWHAECRINHSKKGVRWIDAQARPERTADGTTRWHGFAHDITERKRIDEALQRSQASLEEAQRIAHVGSWEVDVVGDALTWSDEIFRIWEIDRTRFEATFEAFVETVHPEDRAKVLAAYNESLRRGTYYHVEHRLLLPDGRVKYIEERGEPFYDETGKPVRFVGTSLDITDRKRLERSLQEQADFQGTLLDALTDVGLQLMVIEEGRITHVANRKLTREFGFTEAELDRQPLLLDIIHPDDRERVMDNYRRRLSDESVERFYELGLVTRSGERREYETAIAVVPGTSPVRIITVGRDISARKQVEAALVRRERELRVLADTSPGMMGQFYLRPDGTMCMPYASPNIRELFGVAPEDVYDDASPLLALNHPDDAERVEASIAASARDLTVWHEEFRILHPQRGERWMEGQTCPQPHPAGGVIWYGYVHDITERRLAEEAVRDSRERYAALVNTVDGIVREVELPTFRFTFVSPQAERLLGYPVERWLNEPNFWSEHIHPEDREWAFDYCQIATREIGDHDLKYRMLAADGRVVWLHDVVTVVIENGEPAKLRGIMMDITASQRADEALRESEERFRQAFEHSGMGIAVVGMDGRWQQVNPALCRMLGYEEEEFRQTTFRELTHPDDLAKSEPYLPQLLAGEIPSFEIDKRYRRRDGSYVWTHLTTAIVRLSDGTPVYYVSQIEDITARMQLEIDLRATRDRALELAQLKTQFLANMSHEIRTPLNGVVGMTDALSDTGLDEEQTSLVQVLQQSAESLLQIVDDVLDFSKIEAGRMSIESVPTNPATLLATTAALFAPKAKDKGLGYIVDVPPECDVVGLTDPLRLRQILSNFISNAVKFTDSGQITVAARLVGALPCRLRLEVKDSGIGIAPARQSALFQPFVQEDQSFSRRFGGTGLGLAICSELARLMDGDIGLDSAPGIGTTFWVEVPLPPAEETVEAASSGPPVEEFTPVGSLRLLVAEDNPINRFVVTRLLARTGHEIDFAENGREALTKLTKNRYDAILMDCQMPELDGFETTRIIREGRVEGVDSGIPIIALTAYALPQDRKRCFESGMSDYLTKPIKLDVLNRALASVVSGNARAIGPAESSDERPCNPDQWEALATLIGPDNRPIRSQLVELIQEEAPRQLADLREMWRQRDGAGLASVAHSLGGSVANFGAERLRLVARNLECAALSHDWSQASALLDELENAWDRLSEFLNQQSDLNYESSGN